MASIGGRGVFSAITTQFREDFWSTSPPSGERLLAEALRTRPSVRLVVE